MREHASREERFIVYLEQLRDRDDRAALAACRRGLGNAPGTALCMAPFVEPWVRGLRKWERCCYYLVAALFASHPGRRLIHDGAPQRKNSRRNLGHVFAGVVDAYTSEGVQSESARKRLERRFTALLNAHSEDLPRRLRHAISLAKSQHVPVDYLTLLRDLRFWESESHWVQQRWAAAFWAGNTSAGAAETQTYRQDDE